MKGFPPPVLVETWLHIIKSKAKNVARQQLESSRKINKYFGSIELAQLYVEQVKDDEIDVYFL